tara:strand:- start:407 stop:793 length:387 start_codon:yes stop_codon:yes gene_type:complete
MNKLFLFEDLLNNDINFPDFNTYLEQYLKLIDDDPNNEVSLDAGDIDESYDETEETVIEIFSKKIDIGSNIDNSDKLNKILKKYEKKTDYSIINKCINCLIIFKYNNNKFKILNEKINEKITEKISNN